jgi:hypothetical protein
MRRLLVLAGLLVVLALATSVDVTAYQNKTMCTTTCSNASLSCTPASSCSSVPGTSITCDGVTTQCSAANSYCDCIDACTAALDSCLATCVNCNFCGTLNTQCRRSCGTKPLHTTC